MRYKRLGALLMRVLNGDLYISHRGVQPEKANPLAQHEQQTETPTRGTGPGFERISTLLRLRVDANRIFYHAAQQEFAQAKGL